MAGPLDREGQGYTAPGWKHAHCPIHLPVRPLGLPSLSLRPSADTAAFGAAYGFIPVLAQPLLELGWESLAPQVTLM